MSKLNRVCLAAVSGLAIAGLAHRETVNAEPGVAMPEIGKSTVDKDGVAVVRQWIAEMHK